jgi:hypothetical protein
MVTKNHTRFFFTDNLGVCEEFEFERRVLMVVMMGLSIGK